MVTSQGQSYPASGPAPVVGKSPMFRSLWIFNYRIWFIGALVSNIGTWMQRTAQDWLVFNELSDHDSTRMGIVMALQLGPQLFLAPYAGVIADRANLRKLLLFTQSAMGLLALGLGLLVVTDWVEIWHVYIFALALGVVSSLDAPVRQTFVSQLVSDQDLPNAVALNSTSFNSARLIGPALAGVMVVAIGTGPVFLSNTVTFLAMIAAILAIRNDQLRVMPRSKKGAGRMRDGFAYLKSRPDIVTVMVAVFLIGTFGMNSALHIAAMATTEFGQGAGEFGLLNSVMAIGSVAGTLLAARRDRPRLRFIYAAAAGFGLCSFLAAISPNIYFFGLALIPSGLALLTIATSANAYIQITTEPEMRGRVMSIYMALFIGGTPLGAPLVGLVNDLFGARWGLGFATASGLLAAAVGLGWYYRSQHLHLSFDRSAKTKFVLRREVLDQEETGDSEEPPVTTAAIEVQQPR